MQYKIVIIGQVDIDPGDVESLERESPSTVAAVLQDRGKDIKVKIAQSGKKNKAGK